MSRRFEHSNPSDDVTMIGLDFGSTTSSAMVASAGVGLSSTTGRMEFNSPQVIYRSEPVFTPFLGDNIDSNRIVGHIDQWIAESGIKPDELFSGGVIITGLAARRANASELARLIGRLIGEAVIATADDPCLESWLAFMGNCSVLSRLYADIPFINIDIGGGTTNPAFGINGTVLRTGCHFIGARHFQFEPGGYRLKGISAYGRALIEHLGILKSPGLEMTTNEIDAILDFYIAALEAIACGDMNYFRSPITALFEQVRFTYESGGEKPILVFSGGVGELIYRSIRGQDLPGITYYGDLGIDLAGRIIKSPMLSAHLYDMVPENLGRATVYGLTLHSTDISGSTIFLSSEDILPRRDLPVVARLRIDASADDILQALSLMVSSSSGACIQVISEENIACESLSAVKSFGLYLRDACARMKPEQPMVILVSHNYGQALGNYISNWRQEPFDLIIIDEIPDRQAHFVNIGRLHSNIVPVSFYGVC